jgi:prepilin-type N-terminal cleavage/methylation domain-containing protein
VVRLLEALKRLHSGRGGFTLPEIAIVVGILALGTALVGGGVFESLSVERFWRDKVEATRELRHAQSWFAGDALSAKETNLVDNAPPVNAVTLAWTNNAGVPRTASYSLSGTDLVRVFNGNQTVLAQQVVSAAFSRSGRVLNLTLEVNAEREGTRTLNLQTYLRALQ